MLGFTHKSAIVLIRLTRSHNNLHNKIMGNFMAMAMAKTKTKTSATKTVPADSLENVPAEDQAKVTKMRGRPAKTKPVTEEVSGDMGTADSVDLAGIEQNLKKGKSTQPSTALFTGYF